jgi:hypothetical protein
MVVSAPASNQPARAAGSVSKTAEAFPRAERDDRYGVGRTGRAPGGLRSKAWSSMTAPRGTSTVPSEREVRDKHDGKFLAMLGNCCARTTTAHSCQWKEIALPRSLADLLVWAGKALKNRLATIEMPVLPMQ